MADSTSDTQLGQRAVAQRLVTVQELDACLRKQRELARSGTRMGLSEVMLKTGLLTRRQLQRLTAETAEPSAAEPQLFPGYQVLGKLGSGGMAKVIKAKQLSLDRIVAIKVLTKKFADNPEYVKRFYEEGRAAAKLNHPNIVQVVDVNEADGYHFLVMEYVNGKSVFEELAAGKIYPEKEALKIVIQVARALEHASERGFVHRDVKPQNIMLAADGTAKLADLGLARNRADMSAAMAESGRVYGTPYYISPEQIRGEIDIDFRADVYSLGATLYHMVTGKVPFDGSSPATVMHKHLHTPLVPPDHIMPSLSVGIGEVIETTMVKKKEERYATMSAFIQDLEALERGDPPANARVNYKPELLTRLAETGEPVATMPSYAVAEQQPSGSAVALHWFLIVAILGGLSLIANIIQCAIR